MVKDPGQYMAELMNVNWEHDGLHCWELVRRTVRDVCAVRLPPVLRVAPSVRREKADLFNNHEERSRWREVALPELWGVALMTRKGAQEDFFEHAGVFFNIEGGGVFHVDHPHGVVFDSLFELPLVRKWNYPRFFVPL